MSEDNDNDYDIIIDINSIRFLKDKGWEIQYPKNNALEMKKILLGTKKILFQFWVIPIEVKLIFYKN